MSQMPPKKTRTKPSGASRKRRKKKASSPLVWAIPVVLLILVGIGLAIAFSNGASDGDVAGDSNSSAEKETNAAEPQWPPPEGVSPVGEHFGEPISEPRRETIYQPLVRRSIDPFFEISELRTETTGPLNQTVLKMRITRRDRQSFKPGSVQLYGQTNRSSYNQMLFSNDLQRFLSSSDESAVIGCGLPGGAQPDDPKFAVEVFLQLKDERYQKFQRVFHPRGSSAASQANAFYFKVSNSLALGNMPSATPPRQWLSEERNVLLTKGNADNPLLLTLIEFPDGTQGVTTKPLPEDQQEATRSGQLDRDEIDLHLLKSAAKTQ